MLGQRFHAPVVPDLQGPSDAVIALHCSGASAKAWNCLFETLGDRYELLAPEHYGCESAGPWPGAHAFTLADEAARTISLIDATEGQVHLIGHSYGGGVALHVALARPRRIASMALFEPSAFHLLRHMGERGDEAYAEITAVAGRVREGVLTGDSRGAAAAFVDYWNGPGAWERVRPAAQKVLVGWVAKGPLEFRALIGEPMPPSGYRALDFPTLILRGEHAPEPTRIIAERLSVLLPASRLVSVAGAGHMGPFTHATTVAALIAQHLVAAASDARRASMGGVDQSHRAAARSPEAVS